MGQIWNDVDAAITVPVNVCQLIDDTDFKTIENAVAFDAAGMTLVWNFETTAGVITQTAVTPTDTAGVHDWTNVGNGMYKIEIPASGGTVDNDTEGFGWFSGVANGVLPWRGPTIGFRAAGLNNLLINSAFSVTRGLTGTAVPAAAADGVGGLPISDAGGLDLDTLLGTLTSLAAETRSANVLDQLNTIIAVIESQREHHTHQPGTGNIFFIDQTNGATTGSGATGGISDPIDSWQDAHDTYGTNGGHDLYIMVAGLGSSTTVHTEDILPTNRYSFTRGSGRDLIWRPTANNTVAIAVTNTDGCMFSGFQLDVSAAGTGSQNGMEVSGSDYFHASGIWFNATRGSALQVTNCDNYLVTNNVLQSSGASGSGHGVQVLAGPGQTGNYGSICGNRISDVQGDAVQVDTTGGGAVESLLICDNVIHGSTDDGIDIVDSGCVDTIITGNIIGNSGGSNIEDSGTTTISVNNEQWAKQSLLVYSHFAVHIDDVDGTAGSAEGTNGTQGNAVNNLADAVLLAAGLGIHNYDLHGSTDIILTTPHPNWHFAGHNGSSVDPDGQNVNGAHFECLTLKGNLGGDDITARHCKLQSLTDLTGTFEFCLLNDNATIIAGDTYFFQCASGVAGTGTPYIDLNGDDANARNLHIRGWLGGLELRTHTSTDLTSFDCPAGQIIIAASGTGGTVAMRGNIDVTDNASGAVTFSDNAVVNMTKINTEVDAALSDWGKTGFSLAAAGLDSIVVEVGLNARQALSIAVASAAGKLSGAATTTVVILGAGVATTRITATVDADGNRSAVTLAAPT